MGKYAVIEIVERSVQSSSLCGTLLSAVIKANELLKQHAADTGHLDEFTSSEGEGFVWQKASLESGSDAWSNWGDIRWDAHIVTIDVAKKN